MSRSGLAGLAAGAGPQQFSIPLQRARIAGRASTSHGRGRSSSSAMAAICSRSRGCRAASELVESEERRRDRGSHLSPGHDGDRRRSGRVRIEAGTVVGTDRRAAPRRPGLALQVGDGHRGDRPRSGPRLLRPARRARHQQHSARVLRRLAALARLPALRVRHEPCRPGRSSSRSSTRRSTLPRARGFTCS